ncbi:MAG: hypothetical protein HWN65_21185 [Candidatus Helarchaeota archaeon]|nr:hypothetical protein [Candidatus Helarchaeota archaeon]
MSEEKISQEIKRFQEITMKILIPMDVVINRIHRRETIREIYFALADSRERLIQFLNLKRIQEFVIINLQMNSFLNKIIKLDQDSEFTESESLKLITMISEWRSMIYEAVVSMTKNGY